MEAFFYIKDILVHRPNNYLDLSVQLMYDRDSSSLKTKPTKTVSVTTWEWGLGDSTNPNDPANIIKQHIDDGYVTEGVPFRIEISEEGVTDVLFDGYLDPQQAEYDCNLIVIEAVEKKQIDWLNDVGDSATYERMYEDGEFDDDIFVPIPYIISTIPNSFEVAITLMSMVSMSFIFSSQLQELLELLLGSLNPAQFMDIVKLVLRIIYVSVLFTMVIVTVKQLINLLVQPVKYHKSMYVRDLLDIGASHFGFSFSSSIYNSSSPFYNEVILPRKQSNNVNEDKDGVLGWIDPTDTTTKGYYDGTFSDLLRDLKIKYNAKIFFIGNEIRLERRDFRIGSSLYQVADIDDNNYTLNTFELISNTILEYKTDINDKNTLQRYYGTSTQITQSPIAIINSDLVLLKSLERKTINFARANKKTELTLIEEIIRVFGIAIDAVAGIIETVYNTAIDLIEGIVSVADKILSVFSAVGINVTVQGMIDSFNQLIDDLGVPKSVAAVLSGRTTPVFLLLNVDLNNLPRLEWESIEDQIEERIGMLLMENDFITEPKMFIIKENTSDPSGTDVSDSDETYNNSLYLYENFYFINTFKPTAYNPNANQYKIYKNSGVNFCFQDYLNVRNNNYMKNKDGIDSELISLNWNVFTKIAKEIEYKTNELYTSNINVKLITPTGK